MLRKPCGIEAFGAPGERRYWLLAVDTVSREPVSTATRPCHSGWSSKRHVLECSLSERGALGPAYCIGLGRGSKVVDRWKQNELAKKKWWAEMGPRSETQVPVTEGGNPT